jgi:hypothetical protein
VNDESNFACNMNAMTTDERSRYDALRHRLEAAVDGVVEMENGYTFQLRRGALSLAEIGEWVEYEQKCCPFFGLGIEAGPERGPVGVRVTGREGVKEFIRLEFAAVNFQGAGHK